MSRRHAEFERRRDRLPRQQDSRRVWHTGASCRVRGGRVEARAVCTAAVDPRMRTPGRHAELVGRRIQTGAATAGKPSCGCGTQGAALRVRHSGCGTPGRHAESIRRRDQPGAAHHSAEALPQCRAPQRRSPPTVPRTTAPKPASGTAAVAAALQALVALRQAPRAARPTPPPGPCSSRGWVTGGKPCGYAGSSPEPTSTDWLEDPMTNPYPDPVPPGPTPGPGPGPGPVPTPGPPPEPPNPTPTPDPSPIPPGPEPVPNPEPGPPLS